MSIQGKITSLYTDKTMSEALLPRTNTKAVTDDKGVNLNAILDQVAYVDTENSEAAVAPLNADTLAGFPADNYASKIYVSNEIAKAQLGGGSGSGDIDLSGFATKDDISVLATKEELNAIDYPVDSVNGKTGAVQLSASDVGAAPAGYGLGGQTMGNDIFGVAELDNHAANGWYYLSCMGESIDGYALNGAIVRISNATLTGAVMQEVFPLNTNYCVRRIRNTDGVWQPWEWENPPMVPGVEYRTTKRYNGKVVYRMLIDFGALPNNDTKGVDLTSGVSGIVGHSASIILDNGSRIYEQNVSNNIGGYFTTAVNAMFYVLVNSVANSAVYCRTAADCSSRTAMVTVEYTKRG